MKIVIMQVPDTQTEDNLALAIATWNEQHPCPTIDALKDPS